MLWIFEQQTIISKLTKTVSFENEIYYKPQLRKILTLQKAFWTSKWPGALRLKCSHMHYPVFWKVSIWNEVYQWHFTGQSNELRSNGRFSCCLQLNFCSDRWICKKWSLGMIRFHPFCTKILNATYSAKEAEVEFRLNETLYIAFLVFKLRRRIQSKSELRCKIHSGQRVHPISG